MPNESIVLNFKGRVPSKKNSRQIFTKGKRVINIPSRGFQRFKKESMQRIKPIPKPLEPPYKAEYLFEMRGEATFSDIDNMIASLNDIAQDAGIIKDDKYIMKIVAEKHPASDEYLTEMKITEIGKNNE